MRDRAGHAGHIGPGDIEDSSHRSEGRAQDETERDRTVDTVTDEAGRVTVGSDGVQAPGRRACGRAAPGSTPSRVARLTGPFAGFGRSGLPAAADGSAVPSRRAVDPLWRGASLPAWP